MLASGLAGIESCGGLDATAAAPAVPPTSPPASPPATTTATTTSPSLAAEAITFEDGTFTAPDGSFAVGFAALPARVIDADNEVTSLLLGVDEDTQSVVIFRPTALGATPGSTALERAELFLAASGTDIEPLVNTSTRLGPFEAAHFIARLTLGDRRRAVVHGLEVTRQTDVVYVFYTDVGGDDNEAASTFVQSFTLMMAQPPMPTTSTIVPTSTTLTSGSFIPVTSTSGALIAPSTSAPTTPTVAEAATAVDGVIVGFDARWRVTFPDGWIPAFRASTDSGFAYAEYVAAGGGDTAIVRVTEVPAGYEWVAADVMEATARRVGGVVGPAAVVDVAGRQAVQFTIDGDDATFGDTVRVLAVNGVDQLYTISFVDGGPTSTNDAEAFIESFQLTS